MLQFFLLAVTLVVVFSEIPTVRNYDCSNNDDFEYTQIYELEVRCGLFGSPDEYGNGCDTPSGVTDSSWLVGDDFYMNAYLFVNEDDDEARIIIYGEDFPIGAPITAWFEVQPEALRNQDTHPIFTQGYAHHSLPIGATTANYNYGRDPYNEPNTIPIDRNTRRGYIDILLDFNPLVADQVPVTVEQRFVTQQDIPCTVGGGQFSTIENACQTFYGTSGEYQMIAREFMRYYDTQGRPMVDSDGRVKLVRAPHAADALNIIIHSDYTTHGLGSTIGVPSSGSIIDGDHYSLGFFRLGNSFMTEISENDLPNDLDEWFEEFCDDDNNNNDSGNNDNDRGNNNNDSGENSNRRNRYNYRGNDRYNRNGGDRNGGDRNSGDRSRSSSSSRSRSRN